MKFRGGAKLIKFGWIFLIPTRNTTIMKFSTRNTTTIMKFSILVTCAEYHHYLMTLANFQPIKKYCYPRAEDRAFSRACRVRGQGQGLKIVSLEDILEAKDILQDFTSANRARNTKVSNGKPFGHAVSALKKIIITILTLFFLYLFIYLFIYCDFSDASRQ